MRTILLAGAAALVLAACTDRAGNPIRISLPNFGDRESRCELYSMALNEAEARGVATVTIPALDQTLTIAELRVIVTEVCG